MISVTILTKNCQATLKETLQSLEGFDEVLIFDTGSTDSTLDIARKFSNVTIVLGEFIGFGPTHNCASSFAKHDWILSIDSDEVLSADLCKELKLLNLNPEAVYTFLRHNYYRGKHIRCCAGWHPDWVRRLYHRKKTAFNDFLVHEKILLGDLQEIRLSGAILHTPYRKTSDFLTKMQTYSSLFAQKEGNKKMPSMTKIIFHSWFAFFKSYFLKRGFLGGKEGFIISAYNGHTAFYKYLKLAERLKEESSKFGD